MPSVEYQPSTLVWDIETREVTDPDTGETVTLEVEVEKRPFEVRISKWLERDDGYQLHGFVEATEFGQTLASRSDPWGWLTDTFSVGDGLTEQDVSKMVDGVVAVENAQLDAILSFGNVTPVSADVTSQDTDWFDLEIVLEAAETFDIDWLTVDFDPNRGGS